MKRVKTGTFIARDEKIYRLYVARLTWPDGKIKDFPSEEHARAWLEDREPDPAAWQKEIGT
jgi:hypothetical protein